MRDIKKFLQKLDFFGVNLNFKYQANDTYTTALGGLFILIFGAVCLGMGIYYFIPFFNRKNLNIIYYTMNIPKTEQIRFTDSKAAFSIGFQCDAIEGYSLDDMFKLESRFVIYTKDSTGKSNKKKETLSWHYCKYENFYNRYNDSLDYLGLDKFQCLDDYERTIEGIFSDQVFSYYEFSVTNKNKTKENFDTIFQYLSHSDCKLVIYYTDITIDLYNYEEPIKPFLDSVFIQLNPTLDIKRNIYFMNQYLYDDDLMFGVFSGDEKPKQVETLFSRYEEYALYVGLNFNPDNDEYAKVFLRADTKKTSIKRIYQKLMEFYADSSSLLIALYQVLIVIFSYINNFYAEQSVCKRIFFFKELDHKNLRNPKRCRQILELTALTGDIDIKNIETKNFNIGIKSKKNELFKNATPVNMRKKNKFILEKNKGSTMNQEFKENSNSERNGTDKRIIKKFTFEIKSQGDNNDKASQVLNINSLVKLHNHRRNDNNNNILIDMEEEKSAESRNKELKENDKIEIKKNNNSSLDYSFNVCEIFAITFFMKCLKGNLKLKGEINERAIELLYYKLDIHNYLRNMFILDVISNIILDNKKKHIVNFLSRPIISVYRRVKPKKDLFYRDYEENDLDKVCDGFSDLVQKSNRKIKEEKLLELTSKSFKDFL